MIDVEEQSAESRRPEPGEKARAGLPVAFGFVTSLGAAGAGSCCTVPLALASVGIGGGWFGNLGVLALYRPYILTLAVVAVAIGWTMAIRKYRQRICGAYGVCTKASTSRWTFGVLSISTLLIIYSAASSWLEPVIMRVFL